MARRFGWGLNGGDTLGDVAQALAGRAFGTFAVTVAAGVIGAIDSTQGDTVYITVPDATAFILPTPTNPADGAELTIVIKNASGGAMGAVTFAAGYKNAGAFTTPANTLRRTITFKYSAIEGVWYELNRSAADSIA